MKRLVVVVLGLIVLWGLAIHPPDVFGTENEIPAPFAKAKEMAMSVPPNDGGIHELRFEISKDGEHTTYFLGYASENDLIAIGTLVPNLMCVRYEIKTETLSFYFNGMMWLVEESKKEEAFDYAFSVFRILVAAESI